MNSKRSNKYGDEVIGQRLLMRFDIENGSHAWFQGRVKAMKAQKEQEDDDDDDVLHHIAFIGGDNSWHNLQQLEEKKEMQWMRKVNAIQDGDDVLGSRVLLKFPVQKKKTAWFEGKICSQRTQTGDKDKKVVQYQVVFDGDDSEYWYDLDEYAKSGKLQFLGEPPQSITLNCSTTSSIPETKDIEPPISPNPPCESQSTQKKRKIKEENWIEEMETWLYETWKSETVDIEHVMKQVRKLASGAGVRCKKWDIDRWIFVGTAVNLSSHLPCLIEHAKAFQEEFGSDDDGDLIIPLEKIQCFKNCLLLSDGS